MREVLGFSRSMLNDAIKEVINLGIKIHWYNSRNHNGGAFGIDPRTIYVDVNWGEREFLQSLYNGIDAFKIHMGIHTNNSPLQHLKAYYEELMVKSTAPSVDENKEYNDEYIITIFNQFSGETSTTHIKNKNLMCLIYL